MSLKVKDNREMTQQLNNETNERKGALRKILYKARRRKRLMQVTTVLGCLVVFCTTYSLILPAVTIDRDGAVEMPGLEMEKQTKNENNLENQNINDNDLSFDLAKDGTLLQIVQEDGAEEETRIAVVVETDAEKESGASVFVLEKDPENGVQITEVELDDPAVSVLTPEEAVQVEGLEEEVLSLVQAAEEEGLLEPEEREALEEGVQESLEELGVVEDSSAVPQNDNEAQTPQNDNTDVLLSEAKDLNEVNEPVEDSSAVPQNDIEEQASAEDSSAAPQNDNEEQVPQNDNEVQAPQNDSVVMTGAFDCIGEALDSILLTESLQETLDGMTITARYAEGVLPEGVRMKAVEVDPAGYTELVAETTGKTDAELKTFDITFLSGDREVQPNGEVKITFQADFIDQRNKLDVVHIADDGTAEVVESKVRNDEVSLKTDSFSVYAISYTVDFEYSVNGKMYQFSLPGGGFVSFTDLVEVLGIIGDTNSGENGDENGSVITENSEENAANEAIEEDGINSDTNTTLTLGDVEVSEATRKFVADVTSVEFSSPELVDVSKVENETTVGQIKEDRGLECEYSAELTEEQIAEINTQTVGAGDWALISVQPFTSEEMLTVTMKDGEQFIIRVTDAQIKKTVIDAKGDSWEITVTYGPEAEIPDGAELKVREILPEDEEYDQYYQQSLEKVGVVNTESEAEVAETDEDSDNTETKAFNDNYAHIFDIQIWTEEHEIQPASDVSVSIKLLDAPEGENTDLQVVHFGKDGLEVMELAQNDEQNDKQTGGTELSFVTDEFSVYTVVDVNNANLANTLSNGPYALVTGISDDPGATTGYNQTWGQDYFTIIVNANAMMGQDGVVAIPETDDNSSWVEKTKGLGAEGVHAWTDTDGNNFVGGGATQWGFEAAGSGNYRIFTEENGTKQYITHNGAEVSLTNIQSSATAFNIIPNSDGTVLIRDGNMYLRNNAGNANGNTGWSAWVNRNYILTQNDSSPTGNEYKFRLCKESDDFDSFAAQKVSAYSITTNANYVIYRKFEDTQGNETLYALAHDGTFVRVYDGGDTIYWRETDKNIYWNYQMDGNYPVLFTQDPVTHEPIYINPNHSTGQTLSTTAAGLTLIGKDNNEYSTAIECWDQTAYDYAGLRVTVDNSGTASLSTGTRVAGTSDEFLFAVASQMPGATAETVDTVDSDSLGIKITMFDYGDANGNYNAGDKLPEMTEIAGSDDYTPHAAHALVKPYLESGLPSGPNGAMTGLFSSDGAITYSQSDVNHLFLQSYYDENGTFRYRSEDNYAYLGLDGSKDFTVYRQAATPYTTDTEPGHTYYYHGHFMPFNQIDMNNNLSRLMNQYGNEYTNGTAVGEIPLEDGRTYEDIYGVQGTPNFYTGMRMEANFTQPRDGKLDNGDEMIFKFTGDDDMWVYIDDVLVLDIGGIHEPLSGTISFATGVVTNPTGSSHAGTTTLYHIFQNVLTASGTPQSVKDKINTITWKDVDGDGTPDTFADYTNHSFSAFYMERGAGASNLDIQFNLKVVLTNQFTVQKEIPDDVDDRFDNQVYKFQATYMDGTTKKPLYAGIENVCTAVVYKDKKDDQGNPVPVSVDNDGYFTLRAGEAAVFMMADESIRYNVREVDIDGNLIERVDINGQQVTVTDGTAEAGYAMVEERTQVSVMNHPKTQNLKVTKHLTEDSAPLVEGENPVFEFRVYLETTVTNEYGTTQQQLVPYSYGPYYLVKKVDGALHYFTLTGVNNAPVDKGTEPVVCSTTGRSGSINSIPPEYTIIIPNLVVGTNFYVEERRDNIPEGYEFVKEELTEGTYGASTLITEGATSDVINRVLARDETDHQEFDPKTVGQIKEGVDAESHVYNKKPAVIITVEKEWDPEPEDGTTVKVELHRYAKITKGTIAVTLYDNNEAPIEGAVFELYKQDEDAETFTATGTEVTTNVNGIASVSGLEAGTYKLAQKSTPAGYSMDGHTTETGTLTVVDNVTMPQTLSESLTNTALVTAGKVTLNVTDSGAGSGTSGTPIEGATFTLYKDGAVYNTGYTSNSEGKVVVGNLAAGDYYFVQTGTTADYNLPNVTRTEYFTVVENPGVTQEFNQSITNSLKGKGTVSLSLTKDSGDVISGASFQLKSGNTVLETKQTASDGTLSFSSELYEGTYTVHQVNTGSAGDDYATAGDQNVTIEANSMTTQQKSLTFVNEEASIIYTLTIRSSSDDLSVSYNYRKNTDVTLTFDNGNDYYDPYEDVVLSGDVNGTISGHRSSFSVTMDSDKTITLTSTGNSNWSNVVTNALQVSPLPETRSRANSNPSRTVSSNSMDFRTLSAPMLRSTSGATRSVIHTNASPAAAPAGYAEDSTFEAIEITLPTNDGWQYTFDAQDKFDANGDPYYYYIVETDCTDDDYWIDSYIGDPLSETGTITVTNKKDEELGFSFSKVWLTENTILDAIITDNLQDWADGNTISVTIRRVAEDAQEPDASFTLSYIIGSGAGPFKPNNEGMSEEDKTKYQLTKTVSGKITTFTMAKVLENEDQSGKAYTYYVEEGSASGSTFYNTYYGSISEGSVSRTPGAGHADDGEVIINLEYCGYELPNTGGPGTEAYLALGALMAVGAGAVLIRRKLRRQ